jgi:two-component system, sporulation sensor kinase E
MLRRVDAEEKPASYVDQPQDVKLGCAVQVRPFRAFLHQSSVAWIMGLLPQRCFMSTNPLAAINSVALAIGSFSGIHEMLDYALGKVLEVVQTEAGSVYLLDEERGELTLAVHRGLSPAACRDFDRLKLGEGLSGRVAISSTPIVLRNLKDDPRLTRMSARAEGFQAFASVPLRSSFKTYGTLNVHTRSDRAFTEEEVQLLTSMASQIGLAVANTRLYLDLQASERKFRGLVESAEHLIYLLDPDGRIVYANPAFGRRLGHQPGDLDGRMLLSIVDPEDREQVDALLQQALSGGAVKASEFRMLHADGASVRWFSPTSVPLRDEAGTVTVVQCIARDVTERREMQAQIARAERLADLGRMAASIAHEIRNPLGAIVNSINVLRQSGLGPDQRLFTIVTEEAERLNGIISEFLLFARPPARAVMPCRVADLICGTVVLFRQSGQMRDEVEIRVHCTDDLPLVLADPSQMRQVLWNLLDNAAAAIATRGFVDVTATAAADGTTVNIEVVDDGPGLEDVRTIFEPFYTTKAQGTGLGLAVVGQILRHHGAWLEADNAPGRGARFTIGMPVVTAAAAEVL